MMRLFKSPSSPVNTSSDRYQIFTVNRNSEPEATFLTEFFCGRGVHPVEYKNETLFVNGKNITELLPDSIRQATVFKLEIEMDKMVLNGVDITGAIFSGYSPTEKTPTPCPEFTPTNEFRK